MNNNFVTLYVKDFDTEKKIVLHRTKDKKYIDLYRRVFDDFIMIESKSTVKEIIRYYYRHIFKRSIRHR